MICKDCDIDRIYSKPHGLCSKCYQRRYAQGTLVPAPRRTTRTHGARVSHADVLKALYGDNFVPLLKGDKQ